MKMTSLEERLQMAELARAGHTAPQIAARRGGRWPPSASGSAASVSRGAPP